MSFTTCPRKLKKKADLQENEFVPVYKTAFSCHTLPCTLITLSHTPGKKPILVHLQTGYSEADSVLGTQEQRPLQLQLVPLPLPKGEQWTTLLDIVPSTLVYAALSNLGTFVVLQLYYTITGGYTASVVKTCEFILSVKKAVSLCFQSKRYFLIEEDSGDLELLSCDAVTYDITVASDEEKEGVFLQKLKDYNTENNIIGFKHNVCYYDGIAIASVPSRFKILNVFGTRCDAFQLLVWNRQRLKTEWWRWTGVECEAVHLPTVQNVKGNLLWS